MRTIIQGTSYIVLVIICVEVVFRVALTSLINIRETWSINSPPVEQPQSQAEVKDAVGFVVPIEEEEEE